MLAGRKEGEERLKQGKRRVYQGFGTWGEVKATGFDILANLETREDRDCTMAVG